MVEIPYEPDSVIVDGVKLWRMRFPVVPLHDMSGKLIGILNHIEHGQVRGECEIAPSIGDMLVRGFPGFEMQVLSPMLRGNAMATEYTCDSINPELPGGSVLRFICHEREPIANNHKTD